MEYTATEPSALAERFRTFSKISSAVVFTCGLTGLCGWVFGIPILTTIAPSFASMKFNAALLFMCLGIALWMAANDERRGIRIALGTFVVIIAGLTIAEYLLNKS